MILIKVRILNNIIRYFRCDSVLEDNNIGQALASCKNTN